MNFLAHAYLSFENEGLLVGNMISDFVRGKKQFDYPPIVQKGIRLHRSIDAFTDAHEVNRQAQLFFKKDYGRYSSALLDVVYDHFLATDSREFPPDGLMQFSLAVYASLEKQKELLPPLFSQMLVYMRSQNWLYTCGTTAGAKASLQRLVRRARYMHNSSRAEEILETHYKELKENYQIFWKELKPFAFKMYNELLLQT